MKHLLLVVSFIVPFVANAQDGWKYIGPEEAEVRSMVIDGDLILCSMVGSKPMYRSTDAGQTWAIVDTALFPTGAYRLDIIRGDPSIIFASLNHRQDDFYTSRDGGLTWDTTGVLPYPLYHRFYSGQPETSMIYEVLQSPGMRDVLFRSTDLGKTWEYIPGFPYSTDGADLRLGISPLSCDLYLNDDTDIGGAFFFHSPDCGETWEYVGPGFRSVTNIIVDAEDTKKLYCLSGGLLLYSTDGGSSWTELFSDKSNRLLTLVQDSYYPDRMYLLMEAFRAPYGVYYSTSRGNKWTNDASSGVLSYPVSFGNHPYTLLRYDTKADRLYVQTLKGIFKRQNPVTTAVQQMIRPAFPVISVYPQPAKEYLSISVLQNGSSAVNIRIYNVLGVVVFEAKYDAASEIRWNLRGRGGLRVPAGIYIMQITNSDVMKTERIAVFN
jgi:photosystem II stability/assembly factor-like uncharacterized protein